jgi:hypothetical protein
MKVAFIATLLIVDTVALMGRGNKEITSTLLASLSKDHTNNTNREHGSKRLTSTTSSTAQTTNPL